MYNPSGSTEPGGSRSRKKTGKAGGNSAEWMSQVGEEGTALKVMVNFGPCSKATGKPLNRVLSRVMT